MDATIGSDDSGFDAALKALEELESDVSRQRESAAATPVIAIEDEDPLAAMAAATLAELSLDLAPASSASATATNELCDLDAALAATMAEVALPLSLPPVAALPEAPAPAPVAAPAPVVTVVAPAAKPHPVMIAAAALGVFASLVSTVGLVVASRTIAQASLVVADARERQQQMAQVGALVHDLDLIRARQLELLQRQQAAVATTPATKADMDHAFDTLRGDLAGRDPNAQILNAVHEGQNELSERLTAIGMKVSRIEGALGGGRAER